MNKSLTREKLLDGFRYILMLPVKTETKTRRRMKIGDMG